MVYYDEEPAEFYVRKLEEGLSKLPNARRLTESDHAYLQTQIGSLPAVAGSELTEREQFGSRAAKAWSCAYRSDQEASGQAARDEWLSYWRLWDLKEDPNDNAPILFILVGTWATHDADRVTNELIDERHPGVADNKHLQGMQKSGCLGLLVMACLMASAIWGLAHRI